VFALVTDLQQHPPLGGGVLPPPPLRWGEAASSIPVGGSRPTLSAREEREGGPLTTGVSSELGRESWSSLLRSDGSRDDQAGEAGPVKAARREASGPNKKGYSHETPTQQRELDSSSKPNQIKGKKQSAREKTPQIKRATHSCSG
jgi:hypothetical protein